MMWDAVVDIGDVVSGARHKWNHARTGAGPPHEYEGQLSVIYSFRDSR